jgi:hypothetical protein
MPTPISLPDPHFDAFAGISLGQFTKSIQLSAQVQASAFTSFDFSGAALKNLRRPLAPKAVKWQGGWIFLKANGSVIAFNATTTAEPVLRNDIPAGFQSDVVDIEAHPYYAVAIKADGTLVEWIYEGVSRSELFPTSLVYLSDGGVFSNPALPSGDGFVQVSISGLKEDKSVGFVFAVALKEDGSVVTWGLAAPPAIGMPGIGTSTLAFATSVKIVAHRYIGTWNDTCVAVTSDGLRSWSWDQGSLVGFNSEVQALRGVIKIDTYALSTYAYILILDDRGRIFYNADGDRWVDSSTSQGAVALAGRYFLKGDGTVWDIFGSPRPELLHEVLQITNGGLGSGLMAARRDGSIVLLSGSHQDRLPMNLRLAVNLNGSKDFSLVYDGSFKTVTPNFENPLGRSVISVAYSPASVKNVGTYALTYTASDTSYRQTESAGLLVITGGAPIITAGQTASGLAGAAFSKTFSLTDSTNRPVTNWAATGLPSGLSINTTTGAITGTPQDKSASVVTLTATGPGGLDTEEATIFITSHLSLTGDAACLGGVNAVLYITPVLTSSFSALGAAQMQIVGPLSLSVEMSVKLALSVGGSWDFYGDVEALFDVVSDFSGKLRLVTLTRFLCGEMDIPANFSGKMLVFFYTTLNGRITSESLLRIGISFFENEAAREEYREEFIAPRQFDYVFDGARAIIEDSVLIPSNRYGIYNIWTTDNLPAGDVRAHISLSLL